MKRIVYGSKMKNVDRYTIDKVGIPSMVLMERAAFSVCQYICEHIDKSKSFVCICGTGNNGADGIALARMLKIEGYKADVLVVGNEDKATEEWINQKNIAIECNVQIDNLTICGKSTEKYVTMDKNGSYIMDRGVLISKLSQYELIVDAMFGIGLTRPVEGIYRDVIEAVNGTGKVVFSLDIPSGLEADTGQVLGVAIHATKTFTFGVEKTGLWLYKGREYAGEILEKNIGFPEKAYQIGLEKSDICYSVENMDIAGIYERKQRTNKGNYGKVLVVSGSKNVYGAAYFAAAAAYRLGSGLVRLVTHVNNRNLIYEKLPEAMKSTYRTEEEPSSLESMIANDVAWADAVVIGPGLSKTEDSYVLLKASMMCTKEKNKPIIIDADGLNIISEHRELEDLYHDYTILTPHIGEAARLVDKTPDEVAKNVVGIMGAYAKANHVTMVVKDATTVTFGIETYDDKCHNRVCINTTGNAGMATGGSGDILAGMIGAAVSGGINIGNIPEYAISNEKDADRMYLGEAVDAYLHGRAGDMATDEKGQTAVNASDILDKVGNKYI